MTADADGTSTHNMVAVRSVGWHVTFSNVQGAILVDKILDSAEILVDKVTETGVSM